MEIKFFSFIIIINIFICILNTQLFTRKNCRLVFLSLFAFTTKSTYKHDYLSASALVVNVLFLGTSECHVYMHIVNDKQMHNYK